MILQSRSICSTLVEPWKRDFYSGGLLWNAVCFSHANAVQLTNVVARHPG